MKKILLFLISMCIIVVSGCSNSSVNVQKTQIPEDDNTENNMAEHILDENSTLGDKEKDTDNSVGYSDINGFYKMLNGNYFTDNDVLENLSMYVDINNNEMYVYMIIYGKRILYWVGDLDSSNMSEQIANVNKSKLEELSTDIEIKYGEDGIEEQIPVRYEDDILYLSFNDETTAGYKRIANQQKSNQDVLYPSKPPMDLEDIKDNISIKYEETSDGRLAAFITNNNDFFIPTLDWQILFKKSGQVIGEKSGSNQGVAPHSTIVQEFNISEGADEYELLLDLTDWGDFYIGLSDGITTAFNKGADDNIIVTMYNNNDVDMDYVSYAVLLYKNGELQTIQYEYISDIKAYGEKIEQVTTFKDYDMVKLFINEAYIINM